MVNNYLLLILAVVSCVLLLIILGLMVYLEFISFVCKKNAFCYFDSYRFSIQDLSTGKIQYSFKIKILRFDNGGEYFNS